MEALAQLERTLRDQGPTLVALSGGVDSSVLAAAARRALADDAVAVTFDTETLPPRDLQAARLVAGEVGIRHRVVTYSELGSAAYRENAPDRCYHCRRMLADHLDTVAKQEGARVAVAGILPEDLNDHAPGIAALREAGVRFPYVELDLPKPRVRELAGRLDLPVQDKPSEACLSSRIPYGRPVTQAKLEQIGRAEAALHDLGFDQVRVRHHGDLARVEVDPADRDALLDRAQEVTRALRDAGYTWVAMDLLGYRTGALNESLPVVS